MSGGPRPPGRKEGLLPGREPPRPKAGDPPDGALGLITRRTKCQGSIFWACPRLPPLSQRVCDPGKPKGPQRHHPKSHQCWETSDKSLSISETASSPAPISPLSHAPPQSQGSLQWPFGGWHIYRHHTADPPQRLTPVSTLRFPKKRPRFREAPRMSRLACSQL